MEELSTAEFRFPAIGSFLRAVVTVFAASIQRCSFFIFLYDSFFEGFISWLTQQPSLMATST